MGKKLISATVAIGIAAAAYLSNSPSVEASSPGCDGAKGDCNGRDPVGLCDNDALTAASIAVSPNGAYAGQLDLRYSPSCKANWGRFTPASGMRNTLSQALGAPHVLWGRVTVWNPGEKSQGSVYGPSGAWQRATGPNYTYMVNGAKKACTGVEVINRVKDAYGQLEGEERQTWVWGPCA